MQTIYIDVYFLINFTVDIIALHLASEFSKIKLKAIRLVLFTLFLSAVASIEVFLPGKAIFEVIVNILCILLVYFTPKRGIGAKRRMKFLISAYTLLMLIGGIVFAVFNYLKRYVGELVNNGEVNRKLLGLAIIILISVGFAKIFVSIMRDVRCEKSVKLAIYINDRDITVDCFVDTGNFLVDPIDSTPVILLKRSVGNNLFPYGIPTDISDAAVSKYGSVRLIPIKKGNETEIKLGFRPRKAVIISDKGEREVSLNFIIDNDGGSYAGYDALVPASLID